MAFRIFKKLQELLDVDDAGLGEGDVPTYATAVSKFTMAPTGAAAGGHSVTLSGNTVGVLALISTGTMTLAGGANVTLSQAGNAVTISGAAGGGGTQTAISGISASDTLYTSGTVRLTGVGGGITVSSNTGQRIDLSVAAPVAQSVQTQNVIDLTLNGNTAGALALMSSGTISLAGGNNVTLSQAGNAVTISAANQSVQPETQTFIAGISASDTLYTSGNVRLTGVGGGVTVSSNTGQRVDISVAGQSVQTQNVVDLTLSGNTAGALALISSGTMTLAGGNNITVSQAGNAVTISGPNVGGAQTGISGLANSETTYLSGTVSLSELGAITIRSTTGQQFQFSVNPQSIQAETQTFIAGVSASDTLYTSGNVRITGVGGGVTVSSNTGQRIDISVAAQSVQEETQTFIAGVSASNTLYTSGNIRISGSQAVTVRSGTGQLVVIDAPAQSVQVETQTFLAGAAASNTTYTSGTFTITGVGGGITVSSNTGQRIDLSVAAPVAQSTQTQGILSAGVSSGGNTAGNTQVSTGSRFVLVASGNATASQATAAGASTVTISVGTQTVQTQGVLSMGVSTGGNTAGNTQVSSGSRMVIVASGNMTASQATAAGASTITLSVAAQSVQPETQTFIAGISGSDTLYTSGNVRITGVGGGITVSSNTGQRIDLSVAAPVAQTAQTGISGIANSQTTYTSGTVSLSELGAITIRSTTGNQYQLSVNAQTVQTQNLHNVTLSGNTAGAMAHISSGTLTLAGGNNITLSQAGNAVTISAPNLGAGAMSAGVSNLGNSAGATGVTGTQLVFVGSDNITLSQTTGANGGTVSIIGGAGAGFSAGMSTQGNTAGDTGVTGTRLVLVGTGPISLSQTTGAAGGTLSINAPATSSLSATGILSISTNGSTISIGAPVITLGDWQNFQALQAMNMTAITAFSKTPFYWPDELPGRISANSFVFRMSCLTTATLQSFSAHLGVYTLVNQTSAALLGSLSESYVLSTASSASWSGIRQYVMTGIGTHAALSVLSQGEYMFGMMFSAGATGSMNYILIGAGAATAPMGVIVPGANQASTALSQGAVPLYGRGSTTVNAMPANVVASELINLGQGASAQLHPWIYIRS